MLSVLNHILKRCVNYFVQYFNRCNDILILNKYKSSTVGAYINSLERIFKDFGRRAMISKRHQKHNLLMYKIIQKEFDLHSMLYSINKKQLEELAMYGET